MSDENKAFMPVFIQFTQPVYFAGAGFVKQVCDPNEREADSTCPGVTGIEQNDGMYVIAMASGAAAMVPSTNIDFITGHLRAPAPKKTRSKQ